MSTHSIAGECARCEESYSQNAASKHMALNTDGICPGCAALENASKGWQNCPRCGGEGYTEDGTCRYCGGTGQTFKGEPLHA